MVKRCMPWEYRIWMKGWCTYNVYLERTAHVHNNGRAMDTLHCTRLDLPGAHRTWMAEWCTPWAHRTWMAEWCDVCHALHTTGLAWSTPHMTGWMMYAWSTPHMNGWMMWWVPCTAHNWTCLGHTAHEWMNDVMCAMHCTRLDLPRAHRTWMAEWCDVCHALHTTGLA